MKTDIRKMRRDAAVFFNAGLKAVNPAVAVKRELKRLGEDLFVGDKGIDLSVLKHIHVIGFGKASVAMTKAVEGILADRITSGVICTKYGHGGLLKHVSTVEAGHPIPDHNGRMGAEQVLSIASNATEKDLVLCLISGGGSALIPLPPPGVTLEEKQMTTRTLLACGATIHEINTVRKHLSKIKGGFLAKAAYPATLISLILSDVVGDDLDVIASGPTVPDRSRFSDCLSILKKYDIAGELPPAVMAYLRAGADGKVPETPKPGEPCFEKSHYAVIGSNLDAVQAAGEAAKRSGYNTLILSSMIEGETRETAKVLTAMAKEILKSGNPIPKPACLLSGGETTVTIRGNGTGGRNQEFVLASALEISGLDDIVVFSAGTDGTDGPTDAAGAVADGRTCSRGKRLGMNPETHLRQNNAYPFFKKLEDLVITGPTQTNVMDLRMMLIT